MDAVPGDVSVSVKLRAGKDSAELLPQIVREVCAAGADWIVFHWRTAAEGYCPVDAAERFRRIRLAVETAGTVPVFGNGDVTDRAGAEELVRETGCAGVAVGRGVLSDPWLAKRILSGDRNAPTLEERTAFLRMLASGTDSTRRGRNWFLECVKMTFGPDSQEFREARAGGWDELRARWS